MKINSSRRETARFEMAPSGKRIHRTCHSSSSLFSFRARFLWRKKKRKGEKNEVSREEEEEEKEENKKKEREREKKEKSGRARCEKKRQVRQPWFLLPCLFCVARVLHAFTRLRACAGTYVSRRRVKEGARREEECVSWRACTRRESTWASMRHCGR